MLLSVLPIFLSATLHIHVQDANGLNVDVTLSQCFEKHWCKYAPDEGVIYQQTSGQCNTRI